jgi:hypothetical protein
MKSTQNQIEGYAQQAPYVIDLSVDFRLNSSQAHFASRVGCNAAACKALTVDWLVERMQSLGYTRAYVDRAVNAVGLIGEGLRLGLDQCAAFMLSSGWSKDICLRSGFRNLGKDA